jgi:hypothetical protein
MGKLMAQEKTGFKKNNISQLLIPIISPRIDSKEG